MHSAREQFIKAESSEKIKRALLKNVQTYSEVDFQSGEKVYFKSKEVERLEGTSKGSGKGRKLCTHQVWSCILQVSSL